MVSDGSELEPQDSARAAGRHAHLPRLRLPDVHLLNEQLLRLRVLPSLAAQGGGEHSAR